MPLFPIAQATGHTDISPLSGLALIAVTLMFFITGGNVTAAVLIGVALFQAYYVKQLFESKRRGSMSTMRSV